jgi:dihydrolipoamide dehydrogenase
MNSDDVINLSSWPKSLVILGAGVIGCEYATIFANFKQTKVYVIDKADRILPFEDEDVSKAINDIMIAKGITVHHGAKVRLPP